ncbi:hypothetical protein E2C01_003227 [Portunus trituberculatus]|uniref:Uncharacterized protein n=1 Tax=Portunus trituberculatus TaxID=210409 RepID=A0A5B7CP80_PORTR|nr:hypothetical protein [Portunus trituberculatus]
MVENHSPFANNTQLLIGGPEFFSKAIAKCNYNTSAPLFKQEKERKKERCAHGCRRPVWLPRLNDHNFPNYFRSNTSHMSVLALATLTHCDAPPTEEQDDHMFRP